MPYRLTALAILLVAHVALADTTGPANSAPNGSTGSVQSSPALAGEHSFNTQVYHLAPLDKISITVLDEKDLSVECRIDGSGQVTLPLIGVVSLKHLRITEAEDKIRQLYISGEILVHPEVSINITEYFPREVQVLGQVAKAGNVLLPIESEKMSIVEAISKAEGFTRISNKKEVKITRHSPDGGEDQTITVNVEHMLEDSKAPQVFVYPGDVINVPESVF